MELPEYCLNNENVRFQNFLAQFKKIMDKETHYSFLNALVEHL